MSRAALTRVVERLRLQPGDVIVARDWEVLKALEVVKLPVTFTVPLVYAPQGIQTLTRSDLLNLLEQLDSAETPPTQPIGDTTSSPL